MLDNKYNKEKTPFKVPENYFENFNKDIMAKIDAQEVAPRATKTVSMWKRVMPWAAVAAVFASVILITQPWENGIVTKTNSNTAEVEAEIEAYYSFLESEVLSDSFDEYLYDEVE